MKKRLLSFLLAVFMLFIVTGCDKDLLSNSQEQNNCHSTSLSSEQQMALEKDLKNIDIDMEELIKNEDIDDLVLKLYSIDPNARYRHSFRMEHLTATPSEDVTGETLQENIELFYKINHNTLIPHRPYPEHYSNPPDLRRSSHLTIPEYFMHACIGYVLESKKNGVLLEVGFWCTNETVLVNGVEVRDSQFLYDIILAYASDEILQEFEGMLTEGWQTPIVIDTLNTIFHTKMPKQDA